MKKNLISFLFVLFSTILLSACSKTTDIPQKDPVSDKIALQEQIDLLEKQKQNFTLPSWAENLNITTPVGMILNKDLSYQTSQAIEWFNSIRFIYSGDYDTALKQAEKIARIAWIEISEEFKIAQDMAQEMGVDKSNQMKDLIWDLNGVVYTNYSLTKNIPLDYIISISVEENGTLEIVATDQQKMQNVLKNNLK